MGCAQSSSASEQDRISSTIDEELRREKLLDKKTTKMLLLGAGESGKSTVVKQLKLMHQGSYTSEERIEYRDVILANTCQSMQAILDALPHLNLRLDGDLAVDATTILKSEDYFTSSEFSSNLAQPIARLAGSRVVKEAISRRREFQLNDSAEYYFAQLQRMATTDFMPTDEDILRARVKTTGVIEHQIKIKDRMFKITDVGGQRSERKKWLNVFADIDVLIWVVALSEYDQTLREDSTVSRMEEAMQLFSATINSKWFERSTIMLFLNKIDLFAQKLKVEPINNWIHDFPPERNTEVEFAAKFMRQKFVSLYQARPQSGRSIYSHLTTATETKAMRAILNAVTDSVMKQSLASTGLL